MRDMKDREWRAQIQADLVALRRRLAANDREWRAQIQAELIALGKRLAAVEAVLGGLPPTALRQRRNRLRGKAPFGWQRDDASGGFVAVPKQQAVIRRMRRLKDRGLSLREIATALQGAGVAISHVTVKNVLDAAARGPAAGELIEGRHVYVPDPAARRPEAAPRGRPMGEPVAPGRLAAPPHDPGQDGANPLPTPARQQRRAPDRREDGP
jgi:hypothetical protein